MQRWEADYLQPWQQRVDAHRRAQRAEYDAKRTQPRSFSATERTEKKRRSDHESYKKFVADRVANSPSRQRVYDRVNKGLTLKVKGAERRREEKRLLGDFVDGTDAIICVKISTPITLTVSLPLVRTITRARTMKGACLCDADRSRVAVQSCLLKI